MFVSSSKRAGRPTRVFAHLLLLAVGAVGAATALAPRVARAEDATGVAKPAEELAEQAFKAYEAGAFAEAIALYAKAYDVSKEPRILFNVAQIYDRKLQDRDLALSYYRRFLKSEAPEPELQKRAVERVAALSGSERSVFVETAPRPAGKAADKPPLWIGWIATGALAAGAVVSGIVATRAADDLAGATFTGSAPDAVRDDRTRAMTFAVVTDVLAAAAVVAAGVTLYLTLSSPKATKAAGLGGRMPLLTGRF